MVALLDLVTLIVSVRGLGVLVPLLDLVTLTVPLRVMDGLLDFVAVPLEDWLCVILVLNDSIPLLLRVAKRVVGAEEGLLERE
jgi:hypothetical protein